MRLRPGQIDSAKYLFDIVILSWNRAEETLRLFENLLQQQGVQFHIWVVDQGSQADCQNALRSAFSTKSDQVTMIELGRNTGVSQGRNIGMMAGTAPYVICIDNDAYFEGYDALHYVAGIFSAREDVGAISFRIGQSGSKNISKSSWPFGPSVPLSQETPCLVTQYAGAAHALRREALDQTKLYDEKLFFYWEELDLAYQLINAGYTILYDPNVRVIHDHSLHARMQWHTGRYYYLVRNGLYVRYKYERSELNFLLYALGYLIRGCSNGIVSQSIQGVWDALSMIKVCARTVPSLSPAARDYIWEHNLRGRGNIITRFYKEAFSRLPE